MYINCYIEGCPVLIVFLSKLGSQVGDATLSMLHDLSISSSALTLNIKLIAVSTDSLSTCQAYLSKGVVGSKVMLVSDKGGDISRDYGVLDIANHQALHAVFLVDDKVSLCCLHV